MTALPSRQLDLKRWATWPALAWTGLFFLLPLLIMLAVSFSARVGDRMLGAFSLDNYTAFFTQGGGVYVSALANSIEVTLITTAVSLAVAYPLAYILAYGVPARWQRLLLVVIVLPFWTSYVIRSYSWLLVLSEKGVINQVMTGLGLFDQPIGLGNTRGATVLGFVHFFTMLLTLTIYANLVQIKESYRKAAADLGASPLQVFLRITLPLSLPGVMVGAFLTFVLAIGDYITPQILGGSRELLLPQAIMLQISRQANFEMASAMSMVLMLVVSAAFLLFARHLRMERV
ncbi:spermidine/putrescine ABC transporter permease [Hypericibacter adhaerens]|uniref:Spermidine/putrescine ABC transporter permease n=1 Tax=Hypericibacter adhaerens TaxID=2602016 RepID=A0A5J6MXU4_9PROT|nr:ABC transporter permease [Hypericibacter adhaerens]QEX21753.1 spermidine/putrescine ABC transporter permease [Hypericibacter adhaerens]